MKKLFVAAVALLFSTGLFAQQTSFPFYEFTIIKNNPATIVKDQARTGTCWCFATVSFLESEAIRKGTAARRLAPKNPELNRPDADICRAAFTPKEP